MKLIHDSAPRLLHLLLLAELFVHSSSRHIRSVSICSMIKPMSHEVDRLMKSHDFHNLKDDNLINIVVEENRLDSLPHIHDTAADLSSAKMNESLSQLYVYAQSFKLHVDWLNTAKEKFGLPSQSERDASTHLLQLSTLSSASLRQIGQEAPQPPSLSLPDVSSAFDVLKFSIEISERLDVFCQWSKRVLWSLRRRSRCPKH